MQKKGRCLDIEADIKETKWRITAGHESEVRDKMTSRRSRVRSRLWSDEGEAGPGKGRQRDSTLSNEVP